MVGRVGKIVSLDHRNSTDMIKNVDFITLKTGTFSQAAEVFGIFKIDSLSYRL